MHNNYFFLRQYAPELNEKLRGKILTSAFSQDKDEVILEFSEEEYLKCILKPEFSVVILMPEFHRAKRNSATLWEDLYGQKVVSVRVGKNERAIRIDLEQATLVLKLFRPNLMIFDGNLRMFNQRLITDRELTLDSFDRDISDEKETFLRVGYKKQFYTLGKDLIAYLDEKTRGLDADQTWEEIQALLAYLEHPKIYLNRTLTAISLLEGEEMNSASQAIQVFAQLYLKSNGLERLRQQRLQINARDLAKTTAYIEELERKKAKWESGLKNEEIGHLIMAHLHLIPDGATEVSLPNFYGSGEVKVKLKKELSAQKNAESYYRKSKNERIEQENLERNIERAYGRLEALEEERQLISSTEDPKVLRRVEKAKEIEFPFKEFIYKKVKIWVGKNAKNNDLLITRYAHKDEWWLHARDTTGSHVIIKHVSPGAEILEYAARIAAYYSKRKSEGLVPVQVTQRKFIRKGKNLPAGQVIVDKEQTLLVEPHPGL
ncbi:NFACT RNA binding domain-containing protein [Leadbetterella byssophila]|uniref:NFACT RNA binding domain-containing protein n=1 Tax=Leadbetterella byssophila TaxID=316068 RepID=UPI00399F034A